MKTVVVCETIAAPIDRVFAASTDIEGSPGFITGIRSVEVLTEGPVGEGTTWRETRTMFGREATETMWIREFSPAERYVVEAKSHGMHYLTPVEFERIDDAHTRITMRFSGTPETFMAKIMSKVFAGMRKQIAAALRQDLADLKAYCEA